MEEGGTFMSLVEERKQSLLLYFSKNRDFVTAAELSRVLNVSTKTIYRLIKQMNKESPNGDLIYSEKGRGYKLDYKMYLEYGQERTVQKVTLSPTERRNKVMEELLLCSPREKNIFEMYGEYYVSETVITSDEKIISQILEKYGLTLIRKNRMIKIIGNEPGLRKAIKDFIQTAKLIDIEELNFSTGSRFNRYDANFVLRQLKIIEEKLQITIPHPYNINIFSHIYILIARFRSTGNSFAKQSDSLSNEELEEMQKELPLFRIAEQVIQNTEVYIHDQLPEIEIYFLFQYLVSSRMEGVTSEVENITEKVKQVTDSYIAEMTQRTNISISSKSIFNNLVKHIKPMLNRLEHGIVVKNSLLEQIKLEYPQIFIDVEEISKLLQQKYLLPEINEDEIGFLTLYFAQAVESNPNKIQTLIMCTTGIGTSELLKVKVEKKFPEIEILDVVATRNIKDIIRNYPNTDLIITTVVPKDKIEIKTLLVNAMFTIEDQERLQETIEKLKYGGHANV